MKRLRVLAGIAIALLLVGTFVASLLLSSPVDVARDYCSRNGVPVENLAVLSYRGSRGLLVNQQKVEFQVKGANPPRRLVVELHQSVYFLPWHVVEFQEETQP